MIRILVFTFFSVYSLMGCGVRGRPQPPLQPPEIGRGQPNFKRATEPMAFPNVPPVSPSNTNTPSDGEPEDGSRRRR